MHDEKTMMELDKIATEKAEIFHAFEKKYSNMIAEFEKKQREELYAYHKSIREGDKTEWEIAKKDMAEAQVNYKKAYEENRIEKAKATMKFPEGAIVCEWESPRWDHDAKNAKRGEKARVEIFREGDEVSDNKRWNRPHVGQVIYRFLKKDGTTGKRFEMSDYGFHLVTELLPSEKAALDKKDNFIADGV